MGDIGTEENEPYNTTDFYDLMDDAFGELPASEKFEVFSEKKPNERYLGAFHYVVNGVDFIGINIHPDTAFNSHEGYYSDETLIWVKEKLNEIDPDGKKCVFVVGHLSAIYHLNDGEWLETMINGDKDLFYSIFGGHQNTFYLYGHLHGERACFRNYSSGAILHLDDNNTPLDANLESENSKGLEYAYSLVHMGGLRPFWEEHFKDDALEGYGGSDEKRLYPHTGTPLIAQFLVFELYPDRVVFHIRNAGEHELYHKKDKLKEYTVYLKQ